MSNHMNALVTAHPHARAMAEYAEDAAKSREPWRLWEHQEPSCTDWNVCVAHPLWNPDIAYRRRASVWYQGLMNTPYAAGMQPHLTLSGWANNPDYWMREPHCVAVLKITCQNGVHTAEVIPK